MIFYRFTKRSVDEKISSGKNRSLLWEKDQLHKIEQLHNENKSKPIMIISLIKNKAFEEADGRTKYFYWDKTDLNTINFEIKGAIREELLQNDKTKTLRRFFGFVKRNWHNKDKEHFPKSLGSRIYTFVCTLGYLRDEIEKNPYYNSYINIELNKNERIDSLDDDTLICVMNIFNIYLDRHNNHTLAERLWQFVNNKFCNLLIGLAYIDCFNISNNYYENITEESFTKWETGANILTRLKCQLYVEQTVTSWSPDEEHFISSNIESLKDIYKIPNLEDFVKNHFILNIAYNDRLSKLDNNKHNYRYCISISQIRGILRHAYWYLISSIIGNQSIEPHSKKGTYNIDWLDRLFGRLDIKSRINFSFENRNNLSFATEENTFNYRHDFLYKRLVNDNVQLPPNLNISGIYQLNDNLTIQTNNLKQEELAALFLCIDLINIGFFRIGKMKSRGFGRFKIIPDFIEWGNIKDLVEQKKIKNVEEIPYLSGFELCRYFLKIDNPLDYIKEKFK